MLSSYLFCYFTGNEPENECVHFAVSEDGYHFAALNHNEKILTQTLGTGCCRDPFLFRDEENRFHIVATDMKSLNGWNSNRSMVLWDSDDLIRWKNERILDFSQFGETRTADRVWAPQALFDPFRKQYLLYWTHHNAGSELDTITWYAYTKDLVTLTTRPAVLFRPKSGLCGIDADIAEKDGKYYLYQADGEKEAICYAVADRPDGPYEEPDDNRVSVTDAALEGNCLYRILGTETRVMIADRFRDGGYYMQETTDMLRFREVRDFALDHLRPRHGSVLHITREEYERLLRAFP